MVPRPVPARTRSRHPSPVTSATAIARGASATPTSLLRTSDSVCAETVVVTIVTSNAAVIDSDTEIERVICSHPRTCSARGEGAVQRACYRGEYLEAVGFTAD